MPGIIASPKPTRCGACALQPAPAVSKRIQEQAVRLAERVRSAPPGPLSAESFLRHYGLSTREGVVQRKGRRMEAESEKRKEKPGGQEVEKP